MQGDLISRSALIEAIDKMDKGSFYLPLLFRDMVKLQPTAYSVEDVVAELEKEMVRAEEWAREEMGRDGDELNFEHYVGKRNAYMDAMTIVRYGGKE